MYLLWQKVIHSFLFIINLWTTNLCSIDTNTGTQGHGNTEHGDRGHRDTGTQIYIFYNYELYKLTIKIYVHKY